MDVNTGNPGTAFEGVGLGGRERGDTGTPIMYIGLITPRVIITAQRCKPPFILSSYKSPRVRVERAHKLLLGELQGPCRLHVHLLFLEHAHELHLLLERGDTAPSFAARAASPPAEGGRSHP